MSEIVGFEFLIDDGDQSYWTALQGSGGQIGNGSLYAVRDLATTSPRVKKLCSVFLTTARAELNREGGVRTYRDHDEPAQRIRSVRAVAVLECRPVSR